MDAMGLHNARHIRSANLAASALVFYDHAITFGQEVELMWNAPWTRGKFLFLLFRYYGIFSSIFNDYGRFWISWQGWTGVLVSAALAQVILILRIRALFSNDRKVTLLLAGTLVCTLVSSAVIIANALHGTEVGLVHIAPHTYCTVNVLSSYAPLFFIPISILETLLGGLAIYKWFKDVGLKVECRQFAPALLIILVRDSTVYFVVMSALYVLNVTVWITKPELFELPVGFLLALSCVMGSRLILNLRARHAKSKRLCNIDLGSGFEYDMRDEFRTRAPSDIV
ncbi:hypothetical protein FA95DRAFT_1608263 [Auriscalpium vulgare]|uniref:Uncharacterized protein n=1 Tax=Auriscalpium vulgare TaxID=40419 RepID=A0ACB8RLX8_9AGAM|nr:hypothetical protein FA95DRAFT_1608263 [Auriscalpium vulgare]